jgi:hypothetical protein
MVVPSAATVWPKPSLLVPAGTATSGVATCDHVAAFRSKTYAAPTPEFANVSIVTATPPEIATGPVKVAGDCATTLC